MVDNISDSDLIDLLISKEYLVKDTLNNWTISTELSKLLDRAPRSEQQVKEDLFDKVEDIETLELDDSIDDNAISKSEKYRPPTRSKVGDDFLDTLNFDLKESNVQARIKSELQSEIYPQSPTSDESIGSTEIDDLFDDALGESMEDFLSDFEDVIVVEEQTGKPVLSGPIIDILKEQGYIQGDLSTEEELQKVPEYDILKIIIKEHPIPLTKIEELTSVETLSLVLSNLQADNLIEYTNDYQWTISDKVKENLMEFISQSKDSSEIEDLRKKIQKNTTYERQFITAMVRLGIISDYDMGMMEMMKIPEFGILKAIKDNEPINFENIQKNLDRSLDLPPVQLTRVISVLEGNEWITKNSDDEWVLTDKFIQELVSNN